MLSKPKPTIEPPSDDFDDTQSDRSGISHATIWIREKVSLPKAKGGGAAGPSSKKSYAEANRRAQQKKEEEGNRAQYFVSNFMIEKIFDELKR